MPTLCKAQGCTKACEWNEDFCLKHMKEEMDKDAERWNKSQEGKGCDVPVNADN